MVFMTLIDSPQDVRLRQEKTKAYINGQPLDTGSLLIAESRLAWVTSSGMGFSLEYPTITMHAISRDLSSFPQECLCVVVDNSLKTEVDGCGESGNESVTELRFAPEDPAALTVMFQTMSACQRLHPDPGQSDDDEEEDNESDMDLMPEDDQIIYQRTEQQPPLVICGQSDGDDWGLEDAVSQMMTSERTNNLDMEMPSETDQFEDAECDH